MPLDEALVEVALDLSGRPFLAYDIDFPPETIPLGNPPFDPQLAEEFWRAFATAAGSPCMCGSEPARTPPHHRGLVQGGGPGPPGRGAPGGWRYPLDQGPVVRAADGRPRRGPAHGRAATARRDRGPRLRHREPAFGREGARSSSAPMPALVDDPDVAPAPTGVCSPASVRSAGAPRRCARAGWTRRPSPHVDAGIPFLGICVGFQLLYEGSDEDPPRGRARHTGRGGRALPAGVKHPRCNGTCSRRRVPRGCGASRHRPGSTSCTPTPPRSGPGHLLTCDYGGAVTASAERGTVVGDPVPPREVRLGGPRHPGQLRPGRAEPVDVMDLYPAIDIRDGGAVRLVQGDFDRQCRYGDPMALARRFVDGRRALAARGRPRRGPAGGPVNRPTVLAIAGRRRRPGAVRRRCPVRGRRRGAARGRGVAGSCSAPWSWTTPVWSATWPRRYPGTGGRGRRLPARSGGRTEVAVRGWEEGRGGRWPTSSTLWRAPDLPRWS